MSLFVFALEASTRVQSIALHHERNKSQFASNIKVLGNRTGRVDNLPVNVNQVTCGMQVMGRRVGKMEGDVQGLQRNAWVPLKESVASWAIVWVMSNEMSLNCKVGCRTWVSSR